MGKVKVINNRNDLVVDNYDDTRNPTPCFSPKNMESATLDCVETGALPLPAHAADTRSRHHVFLRKTWNRLPSTASKQGRCPCPHTLHTRYRPRPTHSQGQRPCFATRRHPIPKYDHGSYFGVGYGIYVRLTDCGVGFQNFSQIFFLIQNIIIFLLSQNKKIFKQ